MRRLYAGKERMSDLSLAVVASNHSASVASLSHYHYAESFVRLYRLVCRAYFERQFLSIQFTPEKSTQQLHNMSKTHTKTNGRTFSQQANRSVNQPASQSITQPNMSYLSI